MIRALVFDWGGVIARTVDYGYRKQLDEELGYLPGAVEQAVFGHPIWERACKGQVGAAETWLTIAACVGYPLARATEFVARFFAGDRIDAALVALIRQLRGAGLCVGLLSNAPPTWDEVPGAAGRWGMEGLFDAQVFSYQVGALKPDPRMYHAILSALALDCGSHETLDCGSHAAAEETLFIDDSPANVRGALAVGMRALHFTGSEALFEELRGLGLIV